MKNYLNKMLSIKKLLGAAVLLLMLFAQVKGQDKVTLRIGDPAPAIKLASPKIVLEKPFLATAGGQIIKVQRGHATPILADFDNDGKKDLLVGEFGDGPKTDTGGGTLRIYKNVGTNLKPRFDKHEMFEAGGKLAAIEGGCCIAFGPRYADLDVDGIPDMISGSYTGGVSFFKGLGNNKYAAAKKLTGLPEVKSGYNMAASQSPCLADWDGDGDWDVVLGVMDGPVRLYRNIGNMTFEDAGALKVNGRDISAALGGPCVVDWDWDGILDLILGEAEGGVKYYRGTKKGSLELTEDENSVILAGDREEAKEVRKYDAGDPMIPFTPKRPGVRTKPFAADWNGDGKLDLLVGDFITLELEERRLTAIEEKELANLEKKYTELLEKEKAIKDSLKRTSLIYTNPEYLALQAEIRTVGGRIVEVRRDPINTGVVWVYLRK